MFQPRRADAIAWRNPDFIHIVGANDGAMLVARWEELVHDRAIDGSPFGYVYELHIYPDDREFEATIVIESGQTDKIIQGFTAAVPLEQYARLWNCDSDGHPIV